jgi:predicted porin
LDVTNYGVNAFVPVAPATTADSRTRISANYNLGVAILGAGYQTAKNTAGIKKNETAVSVSAPFGAFNVGAIYATSKTDGQAGNNTGYDLAVQYNLSKRTYVALQAQSTKKALATASATNTRVQLAHSF